MNTSRVRTLSETLLKSPRYLSLSASRAATVARLLKDSKLEIPKWDFPPVYPQIDDFEEMCLFYLIFNSINYCYFDQDGKKFEDGKLSGSTLAGVRLNEHWNEIKDSQFLANVDEAYLLGELFAAEGPISLVKERTAALREIGDFLNRNVDFTFEKLFLKYKKNAYFVSQVLPTLLPTWRDPFFKRSQLFVGMVYGKFQDWESLPIDKDSIKDLTVFADYRIPQTLIGMGIIEPHARLLTRLHQNQFIGTGSRKELELRAATIVGSDLLTDALREETSNDINALHIDFLLWGTARNIDAVPEGVFIRRGINHHLTMSTDY